MNIQTITCSDPREDTPVDTLVEFMNEYPDVEVAVQATPSKMARGLPRKAWFESLVRAVRNNPRALNLAVHVNMDWCDRMCAGEIPADLYDSFGAMRPDGASVIRRWQLNYSGSGTAVFDALGVASMMIRYPDREFILQYDGTQKNMARILELDGFYKSFSVLYDASNGNGIKATDYSAPVFGHKTGYSGGLNAANVADALDRISVVAGRTPIWIDAEGGLKTPGTKTFDISRARDYVNAVYDWRARNKAR